jgi:hypothetical protein
VNPQQDKAVALAARGLHVIPAFKAAPGATKADPPSSQGKLPLGGDEWQNRPRIRPEKIVETWNLGWNIAVLTGASSGIWVLDVDGAAGIASMQGLVAQHGPLPSTYRVRTGSGGWHLYFQMPDFDVRNRQALLGKGSGIDVRGTGGFVIAATSRNAEGEYTDGGVIEPFAAAPEWLLDLLRPKAPVALTVPDGVAVERTPALARYEDSAVGRLVADLDALPRPWTPGAGWDTTIFNVTCSLVEIANATWSALTLPDVATILRDHAPYDDMWDERRAKLNQAIKRVGGSARPAPVLRAEATSSMFTDPAVTRGAPPVTDPGPPPAQMVTNVAEVDVSSEAMAAAWLRDTLGTGRLSGMFARKGELVFTPRVGHEGYIEARDLRAEGSASITNVTTEMLQARVQNRFKVFRQVEDKETKEWKQKPAVFPVVAARIAVNAVDDSPHIRQLHSVIHTPAFRADGSLITRPGYDDATGTLFLPTGGQPAAVPETPSMDDVHLAAKWIDYMLQDFAFITEHDRASYIGLLLSPLLRALVPPPYKLGVIEAHQPGSGKTFLARALTSIHGGAMQPELPPNDEEFGKVLSAVLDTQTAPVVVFDNVTGIVRSSRLTGLLTSPTYSARRLGSGTMIEAANDRLWVLTGNNATLSGDLGRRNVRVRIDPGVPNPERRTSFAIADFETWVREHRGDLLWSLLVLVRAWVCRGMPLPDDVTQDSYGRWTAVVRGIMASAGMPGTFDHETTRDSSIDEEERSWVVFAEAIAAAMPEAGWTAKELASKFAPAGFEGIEGKPLSMDDLPYLGRDITHSSIARAVGNGLRIRRGRWFGGLAFVDTGLTRQRSTVWRVVKYGHDQ